jgi:hypothetical protein
VEQERQPPRLLAFIHAIIEVYSADPPSIQQPDTQASSLIASGQRIPHRVPVTQLNPPLKASLTQWPMAQLFRQQLRIRHQPNAPWICCGLTS